MTSAPSGTEATLLAMLDTLDRIQATLTPLSYACPRCHAPKGVVCFRRKGDASHLPRWDRYARDKKWPVEAWRRDVTVYGEAPARVMSKVQDKAGRLLAAHAPD